MLFSSADMATFINDRFEPAWESVRAVPTLTIDFGNGNVVTRTLNGNIATYLCNAKGEVMDIVPGIYTPDAYRERLEQFQLLNQFAHFPRFGLVQGPTPNSRAPEGPADVLRNYHRRQAELLKAKQAPDVFVKPLDRGKALIENPIKLLAAADAAKLKADYAKAYGFAKESKPATPATKSGALARWELLAEDAKLNETVRREQIHRKLAEVGAVKPDQIVKWLYKDVLHADLDDPYLGLGEVLFKGYPFAEEEARR